MEARLRSKYALIDKNDFAAVAAVQKVMPGASAWPRIYLRIGFSAAEP